MTDADFDQGYKDLTLELRSGKTQAVRITGLGWRRAPAAMIESLEKKDPWAVLLECLTEVADRENFLNKLLPEEAGKALTVAWALSYGREFQSQMDASAQTWLKQLLVK